MSMSQLDAITHRARLVRTIEVYERAAEIVSQGWCRGDYEKDSGKCCTVGAIRKAEGGDRTPGSWLFRPLAEHLSEAKDSNGQILELLAEGEGYKSLDGRKISPEGFVICWNDHNARDKRQVASKLHQAARKLRTQLADLDASRALEGS